MRLPWALALVAVVLFLLTLNQWVSLASLPFVAKVAGWDWVLPHQNPLLFLVTLPFRWLPVSTVPIALNAFSAVCGALALGLLARSVMLLPHDRTHEQRLRERSDHSLLSIPAWWLPPCLAVLACGLQLTYWEHTSVATGEMLDLLVFAYVIRCLLEYRISQQDRWMFRFAFVYGLGMTNNWALLGFAPLFLIAVLWIRGRRFFEFSFLIGSGVALAAGLSLYFVLPAAWSVSQHPGVGFFDALRANLGAQKGMLFNVPALRSRALILSLTSILPVVIMGIRFPSSFGDTSAAGAAMTNLMFRVVHVVLFAACVWVTFDHQFSPRILGFGLPFLTFYYLGALSIGYFAGYILLVFGERKTRSRGRREQSAGPIGLGLVGLVWLALVIVPIGLIYRNWPQIQASRASILRQVATSVTAGLPDEGSIVLSDDPYALILVEAHLSSQGQPRKHVLVHTRALANPDYHLQLVRRYPQRWPEALTSRDALLDDIVLLQTMDGLVRSNAVHYLHPSLGFYFERFYPRPSGMTWRLTAYPTNTIGTIAYAPATIDATETFWKSQVSQLQQWTQTSATSVEANYARGFFSRAVNSWGVALARHQRTNEAIGHYERALALNTNNVPAYVNLTYLKAVQSGITATNLHVKALEERFGGFRGWDLVREHGPFDHPFYCASLGELFASQYLFRQATTEHLRALELDPKDFQSELAVAGVLLQNTQTDAARARIQEVRRRRGSELTESQDIDLGRLEANVEFAAKNPDKAEAILREFQKRYPKNVVPLDSLVQLYAQQNRFKDASATLDQLAALAPNNLQVQVNRATLHFNAKEFDQALALLEEVLKVAPQNTAARLYKIFILVQQREYAKAKPLVDDVLLTDPDNTEALTYKGVMAIESKEYEAALAPLSRIIKLQPNHWNAVRNRAIAYLQMGRLSAAQEDYERLRDLMPRSHVAYYGLGEIAYRRKDFGTAFRHYSRYLQLVPTGTGTELDEERKRIGDRVEELRAALR